MAHTVRDLAARRDRPRDRARPWAGPLLVVGSSLEMHPVPGLPDETVSAGGALAILGQTLSELA